MHIKLDKTKLLENIRTEYDFAERTLALVPPDRFEEAGVCGHWSVKDLIAHLTLWEQLVLRWLANAEQGIPLTVPEEGFMWGDGLEALNDKYYQLNKERSLAEIRRDFHRSQSEIIAKVTSMTEDDLAGGGRYAGMFKDSPADAIADDTYQHYNTHLSQIRDWLKK